MGNNESLPNPTPQRRPHSRREFLWSTGARFPMLALIDLLSRDGFFRSQAYAASAKAGPPVKSLLAAREPHFPTKAKHVVFLFMNGAPSQVDTFDPKPALTKYDGTPYQGDAVIGSNNRPIGHLMQSPFEFTKHGRSGLPISSLFPHTAKHVDDLCVIRSLQTDTAAHASGCIQMNTGSVVIGKPSLGSWLSYGLGDRERGSAELRRDDRSPWGSDWQRVELDCRLHARGLPRHSVSQRGLAAIESRDAARRQ